MFFFLSFQKRVAGGNALSTIANDGQRPADNAAAKKKGEDGEDAAARKKGVGENKFARDLMKRFGKRERDAMESEIFHVHAFDPSVSGGFKCNMSVTLQFPQSYHEDERIQVHSRQLIYFILLLLLVLLAFFPHRFLIALSIATNVDAPCSLLYCREPNQQPYGSDADACG